MPKIINTAAHVARLKEGVLKMERNYYVNVGFNGELVHITQLALYAIQATLRCSAVRRVQ
jgi:hypothetical protein